MKKGQKIKSDSPHKNQACHDWRGCKLKILITQYKTALMFMPSETWLLHWTLSLVICNSTSQETRSNKTWNLQFTIKLRFYLKTRSLKFDTKNLRISPKEILMLGWGKGFKKSPSVHIYAVFLKAFGRCTAIMYFDTAVFCSAKWCEFHRIIRRITTWWTRSELT